MPLLYALWAAALLTIIATSLLGTGTVAYRQARNLAEVARQDALAEAALNRAVLALLEPGSERRWRVDGVPQPFSFEGVAVSIAIQDELGRVDLNNADTPLISAALRAAGLSPQATSELSDKILDWRDAGSTKRLHGAKAEDYRAAGLAYVPRNGPFQSIDELKLVLGMTPEIFRRLSPLVTVHSGKANIDPQFAPAPLLNALAGGTASRPASSATQPGTIAPGISLDGRAFVIRVAIEETAGVREAIVRLSADPAKPYWLLGWRRPPR